MLSPTPGFSERSLMRSIRSVEKHREEHGTGEGAKEYPKAEANE